MGEIQQYYGLKAISERDILVGKAPMPDRISHSIFLKPAVMIARVIRRHSKTQFKPLLMVVYEVPSFVEVAARARNPV